MVSSLVGFGWTCVWGFILVVVDCVAGWFDFSCLVGLIVDLLRFCGVGAFGG